MSHNEVPVFVSRPLYMAAECQRIRGNSKVVLAQPPVRMDFSVVSYRAAEVAPQGASASSSADAPRGIADMGCTSHMSSILQCCRQMFARISSQLLESCHACPLATALRAEGSERAWKLWTYHPFGTLRDAAEALEDCFDPSSRMHSSCDPTACYAVLFRRLTSHTAAWKSTCDHCGHVQTAETVQRIWRAQRHGATAAASFDDSVQDR